MNKIFLTIIAALLMALAASAAASYWLALNPPFQVDSYEHADALEAFGDDLFEQLHLLPEDDWEDALVQVDGHEDYHIDWFLAEEYDEPIEDLVALSSHNRVLATLVDGTPLLEILIPKEQMVIEVYPLQGYDTRWLLNRVFAVFVVLFIGLVAALLTLYPIARRLRRLQQLAEEYRSGNLQIRNTDSASDAIGRLGNSMESMADRVAELVSDKEALVNDQQELMRAVAHEFRAPMARMRFALEMHEDTGDFAADSKREVSRALEELDSLVTEVLRYARLQRSAPDLQFVEVKLDAVLRETITSVQALQPAVKVQIDNPYTDMMLVVDPVQLQRALGNVIGNALKYTTDQVSVKCRVVHDALAIHVDDNGPGIDESLRKRIFTPFVRLDGSRTRSRGGAGLGLAIVNGVLAKHGGRVDIGDSPLGGARFTVVLPEERLVACS